MLAPQTIPPRFFEILEEEVALSEEMLNLLDQEKAALISMDMQGLIAVSRKKTNQLARIQGMDVALQELSGQITAAADGKASLGTVIQLVGEEAIRDRLQGYRRQLLQLREGILSKNVINKHFAEDTRHYLNDAISLITSALVENPAAYQKGKAGKKPSANPPTLISREV